MKMWGFVMKLRKLDVWGWGSTVDVGAGIEVEGDGEADEADEAGEVEEANASSVVDGTALESELSRTLDVGNGIPAVS